MWCRIPHTMQYAGLIVVSIFLCNGITFFSLAAADDAEIDASAPLSAWSAKESDSSIKATVTENYGKLPLSFEEYRGQVSNEVKFISRGKGYTLFLTPDEIVLRLRRGTEKKDTKLALRKGPQIDESKQVEYEVFRLKSIGANPDPKIIGLEELPGKSNYFIGNDPAKWRTDVSNYAKVKVQDVYPGIDLIYYGNQHQLEYDWIVAPEANPNTIRFAVESNAELTIDSQGNLILDNRGELFLNKPLIYQERHGELTEIAGKYIILDKRQVGIQVNKYDTKLPLIIDPVLVYSTYLGGTGDDRSGGIAVDSSGNAYITGATESIDFPTVNPSQASKAGMGDVFITKINAAGNALIYSTYLGGSSDDGGSHIAIDTSGNAYVTGATASVNFPALNPFQASKAGLYDVFVTKLNAAGNGLIYSTYLGGSDNDYGSAIALDTFGNAYVTGDTSSANFPTLNPFQLSDGPKEDVFVTKLNAAGSGLVYSTYLGGSSFDYGYGIAVDASYNAYVTGLAHTDFPTANPFQDSPGGDGDAFVTKLNTAGDALVYSTFLGGSSSDRGWAIAADIFGNAYVTGRTESIDFPTADPFQNHYGGGDRDAFVAKLNAAGSGLVYSTYLGGNDWDNVFGIAVDSSGNAHVTGATDSTDFPMTNPFQDSPGGGLDVFVIKIGAASDIYFPEITVGGGWITIFALYNTGSTPTSGELSLIDQNGNPLIVDSPSLGIGSSFPISILPGGSMFLTVDLLNPTDPAKHGWAKVEILEGILSGVATYKFDSEGVVTALAGVLPSQPTQFATIPVDDNVSEAHTTAYAIANPTILDLLIRLCLVDTEGNVIDDTATIELLPGEQLARYFFQDLSLSEFKGTVVLRAQGDGAFVAVGLIQNQDLFTVTPVEGSKAPNIPD